MDINGEFHRQQAALLPLTSISPLTSTFIYFVNFDIFFKKTRICMSRAESAAAIRILSDVLYFQAVHNMNEFMFGK